MPSAEEPNILVIRQCCSWKEARLAGCRDLVPMALPSNEEGDMATGIALDEVRRLVDGGAQLVEVLPEEDYRKAHLPGAINLPLKRLSAQTAEVLNRERAVVVYCWDAL